MRSALIWVQRFAGMALAMQQLLLSWILIGILKLPADQVGLIQAVIGLPGVFVMLAGGASADRSARVMLIRDLLTRADIAVVSRAGRAVAAAGCSQRHFLGLGYDSGAVFLDARSAGAAQSHCRQKHSTRRDRRNVRGCC